MQTVNLQIEMSFAHAIDKIIQYLSHVKHCSLQSSPLWWCSPLETLQSTHWSFTPQETLHPIPPPEGEQL